MKFNSKLAEKIASGDFIVTAEFLPGMDVQGTSNEASLKALNNGFAAINVTDNCHSIGISSIAASVAVLKSGTEPICQIVTRDRNRIALQSDLLGAAYLGIRNILCLSGYHQTLSSSPESTNVYDIDSTQFIEMVTNMTINGELPDGTKIEGQFAMFAGAAANPFLKPLELNMLRLNKKVEAGAKFIQTSAVFDIEEFSGWLEAAIKEGVTEKAAILAGVLPLDSAAEARRLRDTYTDYCIGDEIIERLEKAGDEEAQKKEGLNICVEIIKKLKDMKGLRGIHILSGGKEKIVHEIVVAAEL